MAEFDINKELEVIKFDDYLLQTRLDSQTSINTDVDVQYFYHGHRLGTRVPLFVILDATWNVEAILYFCKIGNVLSFNGLNCNNFFQVLTKLFRRYGSNYGILLNFWNDKNRTDYLLMCIKGSPFLKSELCCIVEVTNKSDPLNDDFIDLKRIIVRRVKDCDLQNALILERVQQELKLSCLDWAWQYEQSDQLFLFSKLVFKNLEKWKNTESRGRYVEGTKIIPMKLMRDEDEDHSPQHILELYPEVGLIIDLSNDEGSYDKKEFDMRNVQYKRIQIESKVIPSSTDVFEFISMVRAFVSENTDKDIIVHCHYGYNRTGLMICAYLIEELHLTVQEVLKRFREARPPGIKHQNYIDKLILRYSDYENK